jgi:hypothetical protein
MNSEMSMSSKLWHLATPVKYLRKIREELSLAAHLAPQTSHGGIGVKRALPQRNLLPLPDLVSAPAFVRFFATRYQLIYRCGPCGAVGDALSALCGFYPESFFWLAGPLSIGGSSRDTEQASHRAAH